ncbi:MAG: hypothetical protein H3C58_11370 [Fimbriimonadaceae bacterium]|nr:hypothetical protein [Fimbriimonadaceae bacterium]
MANPNAISVNPKIVLLLFIKNQVLELRRIWTTFLTPSLAEVGKGSTQAHAQPTESLAHGIHADPYRQSSLFDANFAEEHECDQIFLLARCG